MYANLSRNKTSDTTAQIRKNGAYHVYFAYTVYFTYSDYTEASKLTNFGRSDSRQFEISSLWKLLRSETYIYWKRTFFNTKIKVGQPIYHV